MISILLFLLSVFCIIYYGVVIMAAGMQANFSRFWPLAAMLLAFIAVFIQSSFVKGLPAFIKIPVIILILLFFLLLLVILIRMITVKSDPEAESDYIIVLGAAVYEDQPSDTLKKRIEAAYDYLNKHEDCSAILCGSKNDRADITQSKCMRKELKKMGIRDYRLLEEPFSKTTAENLKFAKDYMTVNEPAITLITSQPHLYRALKLAKRNGYQKIVTIGTKTPAPLLVNSYMRELFANLKYLF